MTGGGDHAAGPGSAGSAGEAAAEAAVGVAAGGAHAPGAGSEVVGGETGACPSLPGFCTRLSVGGGTGRRHLSYDGSEAGTAVAASAVCG